MLSSVPLTSHMLNSRPLFKCWWHNQALASFRLKLTQVREIYVLIIFLSRSLSCYVVALAEGCFASPEFCIVSLFFRWSYHAILVFVVFISSWLPELSFSIWNIASWHWLFHCFEDCQVFAPNLEISRTCAIFGDASVINCTEAEV